MYIPPRFSEGVLLGTPPKSLWGAGVDPGFEEGGPEADITLHTQYIT